MKVLVAVVVLMAINIQDIFSQDCNITSKANDILPDRLCAPVSLVWEVTYRGINDGGTPVEIIFNWDDGNPVEIVAAVNTNPDPMVREWQATVSHVYPQGGNRCNYRPTATLRVNGVLCTSSIQQQNVTVWDTDDYNGGEVAIDPDVFPICVGNDGTVIFDDVTLFNCVPPVENDVPNTATRWTQWVYGTAYTINGILVNGIAETYPFYDAVYPHTGPVTGPTPPNIATLPIYSPNTALVWQFFEVTLRYWNVCNPYDDPNVSGPPADPLNGDFPPVIATAQILIVPYPDATIQPAGPFCSNASAVNLSAATPGGLWSGTGITNTSTGRFNPSVAGPGLHTITYTLTNSYGCTGTDDIQIRVWARPTINILPGTNLQVCPGDDLFLDGNPTPGDGPIVSHQWTGNTAPLSATNIQNPVFNTTSQGTYNLTYSVVDANGCTRSQNVTITVNPVSANIIPDPALACASVNFQLNGNPSGGTGNYTTHTWTGDIAYLNNAAIQTPVFNCSAPGTYSLTYTVYDNNGCWATDNINISVSAVPVANAGIDDTICGLAINLNAIPSIGTGLWTMASGPGTTTFSPDNLPATIATVNAYGTYHFIWTETFGPSCTSSDTVEIVFIQQPIPYAGNDTNICGLSYIIQATPSVGSGQWIQSSGPATAVITDPNSPSTEISTGTYGLYGFVWYENNGYTCVDSDTVNVTLDVVPVAQFAPVDTSGCPPFAIDFANQSLYGATYLWDFGNTQTSSLENPAMTFTNSTSADVIYTVSMIAWSTYGCSDSISHNVTVHPNPSSNFFSDAVPGCSPVSIQFTNTSTGFTSSEWDFGDGSPANTLTSPSHSFVNNSNLIQYYTVSLIVLNSFGCPDTSTGYITVFPDPDYNITVTPDSSCNPVTATISAEAGAQQYFWDFGDGYSQPGNNIIQHFYTNTTPAPVTYIITLVATSALGCADTSQAQITVLPSPVSIFTIPVTSGCEPLVVDIADNSTGATSYFWDFGDGNTSTSGAAAISHTYTNPQATTIQYTCRLYVENDYGCRDSLNQVINVFPTPDYVISVNPDSSCNPVNAVITTQPGALSYYWSFGDMTYENGGFFTQHSYVNNTLTPITYTITLLATSSLGCTDTSQAQITVLPSPVAVFTIPVTSGCEPLLVNIADSSTGATSYFWDFGDGNTSTSGAAAISHIYTNPQATTIQYTCRLYVENAYGCKDSLSQTINVFPTPEYIITVNPDSNCNPVNAVISTQPGALSYNWSFGDMTYENGSYFTQHSYVNITLTPMTYTITLLAASSLGCTDTSLAQITVLPSPVAIYTIPVTSGCEPLVVNIADSSTGATSYFWDFGDGNTSTSGSAAISHTYTNPQATTIQYTCWLYVENAYGCRDSLSQIINVFPTPDYVITVDPDSSCHPVNAVITTQPGSLSYNWSFGDMTYENGSFFTQHSYVNNASTPLTYTITLLAASSLGCTDTSNATITVLPVPHIQLSANPPVGCTPLTVTFSNTSSGASQFNWSFGDGNVSGSNNAIVPHEFINNQAVPVTFETWLAGQNDYGCRDSVITTITVNPAVTALFNCDTTGCSPLTISLTSLSFGASAWNWNFGDGSYSTLQNPQHIFINPYTSPLNYNITLSATSVYGCNDTYSRQITVYPTPHAEFTATPSVQIFPSAIVSISNNTSSGAWNIHWDFGDGLTSTVVQPGTHTYTTWGNYNITLIVSNAYCSDTASNSVAIVAPPPVSQFSIDLFSGCSPLSVQFTNNSQYAETYTWDFGDGTTSSSENPTHTYYNEGEYMVKLWANGPGGQQLSTGGPIHVFEQPTAYFSVSPTVVFIPDQPVLCFNMSQNATAYLWDFGDGTTSSEQNPSHYYQEEGEYTISLWVSTQYNCTDSFAIPRAVVAKAAGQIEFPSAFTPSPFGSSGGKYDPADLNNDIFHPVHVGVDEFQLSIFNRWGELIFESREINIGWDGYYRNEICKQDVYVWKVNGKFINGSSFINAGDVTLLR